jgi:hypothetical protein
VANSATGNPASPPASVVCQIDRAPVGRDVGGGKQTSKKWWEPQARGEGRWPRMQAVQVRYAGNCSAHPPSEASMRSAAPLDEKRMALKAATVVNGAARPL